MIDITEFLLFYLSILQYIEEYLSHGFRAPAAGASASSLSRDQLKSIFQTRTTRLPTGEKAAPVNLPQGGSLRVGFDQAVLGLGPDQVARYWVDRKIRGGKVGIVFQEASAALNPVMRVGSQIAEALRIHL